MEMAVPSEKEITHNHILNTTWYSVVVGPLKAFCLTASGIQQSECPSFKASWFSCQVELKCAFIIYSARRSGVGSAFEIVRQVADKMCPGKVKHQHIVEVRLNESSFLKRPFQYPFTLQVIAFTACTITVFLMIASAGAADWVTSEGWREGLFVQCVNDGAATPIPFDGDAKIGCRRAHSAGKKVFIA